MASFRPVTPLCLRLTSKSWWCLWKLKFRCHMLHTQSWWSILASVLQKAWNTLSLGTSAYCSLSKRSFEGWPENNPCPCSLKGFSFLWSGRSVQCLGTGCISQAVSAWLGCLQHILSAMLLLCGHQEAFKVLFIGSSFQKFISLVKCSLYLPSAFLPIFSSKKTEVVSRH